MRGDRTIEPRVTREQVEQAITLAASDGRQQKTWYVPSSLVDRVAAAAYWAVPVTLAEARASGAEIDLTGIPDSASAIVESALWAEVLRLERRAESRAAFPCRTAATPHGTGSRRNQATSASPVSIRDLIRYSSAESAPAAQYC